MHAPVSLPGPSTSLRCACVLAVALALGGCKQSTEPAEDEPADPAPTEQGPTGQVQDSPAAPPTATPDETDAPSPDDRPADPPETPAAETDAATDDDDDAPPLRAVAVAADQQISYALMSDGTVRAWGVNDSGALGIGSKDTDAATPVIVEGLRDIDLVVAGGNTGAQTACARSSDGTVSCWGARGSQFPGEAGAHQLTPVEIPALHGARDLCVGSNGHGCAVLADGQVACWGRNTFGEVGVDGGATTPTPVEGGEPGEAVAVGCGSNHSCALTASGEVWCWGHNSSGQVDPTSTEKVPAPRRVEGVSGRALVVAGGTSCVLGEAPDSVLSCWGRGFYQGPKAVEGLGRVVDAAASEATMCVIEDGGMLRCRGENTWGEVGTGAVGRVEAPVTIAGFDDEVVSVAPGERHTCAATASGAVYCWGLNQRGGLGDGTLQDRLVPTPVEYVQQATLPPPESGFDDVKQAAEATDWSDLPEGCTHSPRLTLTTPRREGDTLEVVSAYAHRQDPTRLDVRLANYRQFRDELYFVKPRAEQVVVSVKLFKVDDERSPRPIDAGTYAFSADAVRWMLPHLEGRNYSYSVANLTFEGVEDAGHVELTHVGEHWVCGRLAIRTRDEVIEGDFAAQVVPPT